tara:strand:+ start:1709 stop:2026 length:318 start_codon:yes stop_codon:yes gene_type:complete
MNFDKIKLKCECGGSMQKAQLDWKGISVRGWTCKSCKEELVHPEDAQKALELERARKKNALKVKLRKVGKSSVVTVPHVIMESEKLKDGQILEWSVEGDKMVLVP